MLVHEVMTDVGMKAKYMECKNILKAVKMRMDKTIGEGMSGFVALCYHDYDATRKRAMKVFEKDSERKEGICLEDAFLREVAILQALDHKHIMAGIKAYDSPEFRVISMPFYPEGILTRRLPNMTLDLAHKVFLQLTSAVHYLHRRRIVHRDIRPDNILLTNGDEVILCDFGLAKVIPETQGASSGWQMNYFQFDALAMGQTLWSLIFKQEEVPQKACLHCLCSHHELPSLFRLLIERLCHHDDAERWSVEEMVEKRHAYPELGQYLDQVKW